MILIGLMLRAGLVRLVGSCVRLLEPPGPCRKHNADSEELNERSEMEGALTHDLAPCWLVQVTYK